jgi:hypothetical protein
MGPCQERKEVDVPVECGVWPNITAQIGRSVPLLCRDEFAVNHTAIFFLGG